MKKRVISLLLSAALLLSVFSVANAAEGDTADTSVTPTAGEPVAAADGFQEMASNSNFTLYFNSENCYIALQDKRTNTMVFQSPGGIGSQGQWYYQNPSEVTAEHHLYQ